MQTMTAADGIKLVNVKHLDRLFIGGAWVAPSSDSTIEVISPVTEEVAFVVAEAHEADMDRAVAAAREAFDHGPWPRMTPAERGKYLEKFAAAMHARADDLAHAYTAEIGVLYSSSKFAAPSCAGVFERYAALANDFQFIERHEPLDGGGPILLVREPVGVVASVVPWNGPLFLACQKVAPALLAGCTVVLKAAPETPVDAYIMAEIAEEIGLPAGVLNVLCADRAASEHLIRNPAVDKVSFTGSTAAGKKIASIVAERMGRYTMELGGKSAAIVLDDMDTQEAVTNLAGSICQLSGQVCAALSRVIVPRARHDEFAESFAATMSALKAGDPYDPETNLGPLAMKRQLERVESYIKIGTSEGARLVVGGGRPAGINRGYYFEPTLFANVDNSMRIAQEEIFGPVISLIPADSEEDAIRIANDSNYGLNGAVLTNDSRRAYEIARKVRTGSFAQGRFRLAPHISFGGFKQSGIGREGGREGLQYYLEPKTIMLDEFVENP